MQYYSSFTINPMLKKSIFATLLASSVVFSANAQNFYLKAGIGTNFKAASTSFSTSNQTAVDLTINNSDFVSAKDVAGSYGKGFTFNITPGFKFNDYVGVELDYSYLAGSKITVAKTTNNNGNARSSSEQRAKDAMFLAPSLVLTTGGEGKFKPYARFGVILPLGGKIVNEYSLYQKTATTTEVSYKSETKASFTLGFVGGLGGEFNLNDNLSIYGELVSTSLAVPAKKTTITAFEQKVNGNVVVKHSDLKTYQKEINYVKELTTASNENDYNTKTVDQDKPLDQLREYANFASLGIRIGVKYAFGSK